MWKQNIDWRWLTLKEMKASAFLCRSEERFHVFIIGTPPASLMNSPCLLPVGICFTYLVLGNVAKRWPCPQLDMTELLPAGHGEWNNGRHSKNPCGQMPGGRRPLEAWWGGLHKVGAQNRKQIIQIVISYSQMYELRFACTAYGFSRAGLFSSGLCWHQCAHVTEATRICPGEREQDSLFLSLWVE